MRRCKKCGKEFSSRQLVGGEIKNVGHREYCLECSPWGKHNTRRLNGEWTKRNLPKITEKTCSICGRTLPISAFYRKTENKSYRSECKECFPRRRLVNHFKAVEYKGGKCQKCGYDDNISALDFHHRDPNEKEFRVSDLMFRSWDTIKKEIDKCDLLCSRCHRELHNPDATKEKCKELADMMAQRKPLRKNN